MRWGGWAAWRPRPPRAQHAALRRPRPLRQRHHLPRERGVSVLRARIFSRRLRFPIDDDAARARRHDARERHQRQREQALNSPSAAGNWAISANPHCRCVRCGRAFENPPLTTDQAESFLTYLILGVIIGGRLGYVFFYNLLFHY